MARSDTTETATPSGSCRPKQHLPGLLSQASEIGDLSQFVRSARRVTQRHIMHSPLTF